jgi:hypothetical protein
MLWDKLSNSVSTLKKEKKRNKQKKKKTSTENMMPCKILKDSPDFLYYKMPTIMPDIVTTL